MNMPSQAGTNMNMPSQAGMNMNMPSQAGMKMNMPSQAGMNMNMPSQAGMKMNVAPQGGMNMNRTQQGGMNKNKPPQGGLNQSQTDPVAKAVADNIMGKFPTKKPIVRCHECGLDFTSQIVLDAHLQGARHAKQIRSKNIMATLKQTNMSFTKEELTSGLKCNPCNVLLNSIQQLQTHLNGNRHQKKLAKGDWSGKEIVSKSGVPMSQPNSNPQPAQTATNLLTCGPCNKFFNSPSQLNVHMASQKHSDKVNHITYVNPRKKRYFPYSKKPETIPSLMNSITSMAATKALTSNFVSAGYQQSGY